MRGRGGGSLVNRLDSGPAERSLSEAMGLLLHVDAISVGELLEGATRPGGNMPAARRNPPDLAAMAGILERARDESVSADVWLSLDIDFHRTVAESASNRVLLVPHAALHALAQPRLDEAILPLIERSEINAQHQAIHDSIDSRDVSGAGAAVDRHLDHLEQLYRGGRALTETAPTCPFCDCSRRRVRVIAAAHSSMKGGEIDTGQVSHLSVGNREAMVRCRTTSARPGALTCRDCAESGGHRPARERGLEARGRARVLPQG